MTFTGINRTEAPIRWFSCLMFLVLAAGILTPPAPSLVILERGEDAIGTLDVCHAAAPALSSGGEMPCAVEDLATGHIDSVVSCSPVDTVVSYFFTPSCLEQPPRS